MQLTTEQKDIIVSQHSRIKVNAYAGSGKSETIVALLKSESADKKKLYITFSKKMADEAKVKLQGVRNVDIRTTYSLAYKYHGYKFASRIVNNMSISYYAKLLGITLSSKDDYDNMNMAISMFNYWLSSKELKIKILRTAKIGGAELTDIQFDIAERMIMEIFSEYYDGVITHAIYMKMWQLTKPSLKYDYDIIVLDEAQDISECLAVVLEESEVSKIICVGDIYQEIFLFSGQKSGMSYFNDWKTYPLTNSFRIGDLTAHYASILLAFFNQHKPNTRIKILGKNKRQEIVDKIDENKKHMILCRTNISMIDALYKHVILDDKTYYVDTYNAGTKGHIKMNRQVIDNVYNLRYRGINNAEYGFMSKFNTYEELKLYYTISSYKDYDIGCAIYLVESYEEKLLKILDSLERNVSKTPESADILISTIHQVKGKTITIPTKLDSNFLDIEEFEKYVNSDNKSEYYERIKEELYILYVAMTRSSGQLELNAETLMLLGAIQNIFDNYISTQIHKLQIMD